MGVAFLPKKTACERAPFELLHDLQHATAFSKLSASSGASLTGITWSRVSAGCEQ